MKAPIEASVLYVGPFWVGVLANITTNNPIDRLLASDIRQRPGAVTALIIIVVVIFVIVVNQLRVIRKTGWLPWYVAWYLGGGVILVVLSQLPGLTLRIHHYIIAMAFVPGTAFPTRLSAMYQGFLLGLFLNGVAAFGFAPILQTSADVKPRSVVAIICTDYTFSLPAMALKDLLCQPSLLTPQLITVPFRSSTRPLRGICCQMVGMALPCSLTMSSGILAPLSTFRWQL